MDERRTLWPRGPVQDALRRVSFCRSLSSATIEALADVAQVRHYPRGTVVTVEGEPAEAMYVVLQGQVKVTRSSIEGREQIMHVVKPGDHFNTVPIFDGRPCPATNEVVEAADLLVLSTTAMEAVLADYPDLARALVKEFAGRLRHLVGLVAELSLLSVQARLARLILRETTGNEAGTPRQPLTQTEIAAQLGTVREVISRALKSFEAEGLIELMGRGHLQIVDRAGLERRAEL